MIYDQQVEPGARVNIDAVAATLDMSITPLREAMARLVSVGLLIQDANRGFTVAQLLTAPQFHALFTARRVLELAALEDQPDGTGVSSRLRAPTQVTDADLAAVQAINARMKSIQTGRHYSQFSLFSRLDGEFHGQIVGLCGNEFIVNAWSGLHFHLHVSRLYSGAGVIDYREAVKEHDAIVRAVVGRNPRRLVDAATRHVESAEERLVSLLPSIPAQATGKGI